MKQNKTIIFYFCILTLYSLFSVSFSEAETKAEFNEIIVLPCPFFVDQYYHGYVEHRAFIINTAFPITRNVKLQIPYKNFDKKGNTIYSIERSISIGPLIREELPFYQPALPIGGNDMAIYINGIKQENCVPMPTAQREFSRSQNPRVSVLVGQKINKDDLKNSIRFLEKTEKSYDISVAESWYQLVNSKTTPDRWSKSWLGYSSFDGIIVDKSDMEKMSEATRMAIWQYVNCGGALLIIGDYDISQIPYVKLEHSFPNLTSYFVGFGEVIVLEEPNLKKLSQEQAEIIVQSWSNTFKPWKKRANVIEANKLFPVTENVNVPVGKLIFLMILLAIIIGPVNFFILSKLNKLILIFWTVPVISLIACIFMFAFSVFGENTKEKIRLKTLTILDEVSHSATTIGLAGYYLTLTPADGLRFSYNTEITPLIGRQLPVFGKKRRINWTQDQHLSEGWVSARIPAHFMIRKSETRTENLLIKKQNNNILIENKFGVEIECLWLADSNGIIYEAMNIAVEDKILLKKTGKTAKASNNILRNSYTMENWADLSKSFIEKPDESLLPGTYIAILDESLFLEHGLSEKVLPEVESLVFGIISSHVLK